MDGFSIEELFDIAALSEKVLDYGSYLLSCAKAHTASTICDQLLSECAVLMNDLETEKRHHVDELRLINQDFNCLESVVKRALKMRAQQKLALKAKSARLHADGEFLRISLATRIYSGDSNTQNLLVDLFRDNNCGIIDCSMCFESYDRSLRTDGIEKLSENENKANAELPEVALFDLHSDFNRQKPCTACARLIHRNAPTCPFCKTRIVSKCARRRRTE